MLRIRTFAVGAQRSAGIRSRVRGRWGSPQFPLQQRHASWQQWQRSGSRGRFNVASMWAKWSQRPTFYVEVGGLGLVVGGFYVSNVETVPVSGRRRFNIISSATEESLAAQAYQQILQQYRGKILSEHDPRAQHVRAVLERLIPASGLENQHWEVFLIDEPNEKNAFVIPGGKVFVFTGLLPICKNADGLAAVLGHEIAHNLAHHMSEKITRSAIVFLAVAALEVTGIVPFSIPDMFTNLIFERPNGRQQESEADFIGLMMMAQSCFNPDEAVSLWGRMERAEKNAPPEFLSTHPSSHSRMDQIREWLPQAREKAAEGQCGSVSEYANEFRKAFRQPGWS